MPKWLDKLHADSWVDLFSKALASASFKNDLWATILCQIFQKAGPNDVASCRPLSLALIARKAIERILKRAVAEQLSQGTRIKCGVPQKSMIGTPFLGIYLQPTEYHGCVNATFRRRWRTCGPTLPKSHLAEPPLHVVEVVSKLGLPHKPYRILLSLPGGLPSPITF